MSLLADLTALLLRLPAVTAIVGDDVPVRIWSEWQRATVLPCIVLEIDSEDNKNALDGHPVLTDATVVVTCRANSRLAADALAVAVRTNGTDPPTGIEGYSCDDFDIVIDDVQRSDVPKGDGSVDHWYDTLLDCSVLRNGG